MAIVRWVGRNAGIRLGQCEIEWLGCDCTGNVFLMLGTYGMIDAF